MANNISSEILGAMLEELSPEKDTKALCNARLACHAFQDIIDPQLYRAVTISNNYDLDNWDTSTKLLHTFKNNPPLGRHIKRLSVVYSPDMDMDLLAAVLRVMVGLTSYHGGMAKFDGATSLQFSQIDSYNLLRSLTCPKLEIFIWDIPVAFEGFMSAPFIISPTRLAVDEEFLRKLRQWPSLKQLAVPNMHTNTIIPATLAPALTVLDCYIPDARHWLPTHPGISRLVLQDEPYGAQWIAVAPMLKNLRWLHLTFSKKTECEKILGCIAGHLPSLESLNIRLFFEELRHFRSVFLLASADLFPAFAGSG